MANSQNKLIENSIFKNLELSDEEIKYLTQIATADNMEHNIAFINKKIATSVFFLAKEIEASNKSNSKSANRMVWLTVAIAAASVLQIIELALKAFHII